MPLDFTGLQKKDTTSNLDFSGLEKAPALQSSKPENNSEPTGPSGFRKLLGMGTRVGSGMLSAEGGIPGAIISGGGEGLAQLIEGPDSTPTPTQHNEDPSHAYWRGLREGVTEPIKKIGVEAAFGAIPFGKVVKGGDIAGSAMRSGALGSAHTTISDLVGGHVPSLKELATSFGLGGAFGAATENVRSTVEPRPRLQELPRVANDGSIYVTVAPSRRSSTSLLAATVTCATVICRAEEEPQATLH